MFELCDQGENGGPICLREFSSHCGSLKQIGPSFSPRSHHFSEKTLCCERSIHTPRLSIHVLLTSLTNTCDNALQTHASCDTMSFLSRGSTYVCRCITLYQTLPWCILASTQVRKHCKTLRHIL